MPMTSSDEEIIRLIDKTEANLKRIEKISGRFICFTLNEWRYATRHIMRYHSSADVMDVNKAIGHLKRAYFDSCDVLLDCLLDRVSSIDDEIRGFAGIVAAIVPDFNKFRMAVHSARNAHLSAQTISGEERERTYDALDEHCRQIEAYLQNMDATKDVWQADIRKQKLRDRLPVIWTAIGITVTIILAIIFN